MTITSSGINAGDQILSKYTCEGDNINPPLTFSKIPDKAKSLALIMDDPDAPGSIFTHWILYDMSPATLQIMEGQMPTVGMAGTNDFGKIGYGGPCPPSGSHRYYLRLYALDAMLGLSGGATKDEVEEAMKDHILEMADLMGTYTKGG